MNFRPQQCVFLGRNAPIVATIQALGIRYCADLNGSVGSISDLKPKGPGFESRIRQGYCVGDVVIKETDA
jgi:hypothetical protein